MRNLLLPHRNLLGRDDLIGASIWRNKAGPLADYMEWQLGLDIELEFEMTPNLGAIGELLGYDARDELVVTVEWHSSSTRFRENCWRSPLSPDTQATVQLPGARIGGVVTLRRCVVTRSAIATDAPFAPMAAGSIIWFDELPLRIEGSGAQFAVYFVDFKAMGLDDRATWSVQAPIADDVTAEDFDAPATESISVRLNEGSALAGRLVSALPDDEVATLGREQIACQIAERVIELARSEAFRTKGKSGKPEEYEPGTLGDMVCKTMAAAGIGSTVELADTEPSVLGASIQARYMEWSRA